MKKKLGSLPVIWLFVISTPIFIFLLYLFRMTPSLRLQIVVLAAFFYIGIATIHHKHHGTLSSEVVIEYILIALLSLIMTQAAFTL